jgi:hypothetical protein
MIAEFISHHPKRIQFTLLSTSLTHQTLKPTLTPKLPLLHIAHLLHPTVMLVSVLPPPPSLVPNDNAHTPLAALTIFTSSIFLILVMHPSQLLPSAACPVQCISDVAPSLIAPDA